MTFVGIRAIIALLTLSAGTAPTLKDHSSVKHLRKPDRIPPLAAALLETRMAGHGDDLEFLLANVLMLNRENVEIWATGLAKTPKLARPRVGESDLLNALLPARFFDLQDELQAAASNLAIAAHSHDDRAMAKAFGHLTETCVACHSIYLDDALGPGEGKHP
jgi:cytochrome c'